MIGFIVAGLIIGALARLIKPGKQNLGLLATLALGLVDRSSAAPSPTCSARATSWNSTSWAS